MTELNSPRIPFKIKLVYFVVDLLLLNIAYFGLNYMHRGTFTLYTYDADYVVLLYLFNAVTIFINIFSKKLSYLFYRPYLEDLYKLGKLALFKCYFIAVIIFALGLHNYARTQIYGTVLFFLGLEVFLYSAVFLYLRKKTSVQDRQKFYLPAKGEHYRSLFFIDFCLLNLGFFILFYLQNAQLDLNTEYAKLLLLVYAVWFFSSWLAKKFNKKAVFDFYSSLDVIVRSCFLMLGILAAVVFLLRMYLNFRIQVFGTILYIS